MGSSKLTRIQREMLDAVFARERGLFLTGGAALAGFHLGHRRTDDLDLFTADADAFERAKHVIPAAASAIGARVEIRQDAPGFRRYAVVRDADAVVVDTVHEPGASSAEKLLIEGILVDTPQEILANKLTALVGRMEERDLVDVLFLERSGLRVEDALDRALAKDGGCTPATLAWLISQIEIPDQIDLPAAVSATELRHFAADLVKRLRRAAMP